MHTVGTFVIHKFRKNIWARINYSAAAWNMLGQCGTKVHFSFYNKPIKHVENVILENQLAIQLTVDPWHSTTRTRSQPSSSWKQ